MSDKFQNVFRIQSSRASWHNYNVGSYFITICTNKRENYFGKIFKNANGDNEMELSEIGRYVERCLKNMTKPKKGINVPLFVIMPNHIHLILISTSSRDATRLPMGVNEDEDKNDETCGINLERSCDVSTNIATRLSLENNEGEDKNDETCGINLERSCDVSTNFATRLSLENNEGEDNKAETCEINSKILCDISIGKDERMQEIAYKCGKASQVISRFKSVVSKYATTHNIQFAWQPRFYDHIIRNTKEMNGIANYITNNVASWEGDDYCDY